MVKKCKKKLFSVLIKTGYCLGSFLLERIIYATQQHSKYRILWAALGLGLIGVHSPLSAGKVTLSLKKGSDWVAYDERNLDGGRGDYDNGKIWLQFPDYDTVVAWSRQFQARRLVEEIIKDDIKREVDAKILEARRAGRISDGTPLVYNMLYKGSADTRMEATTNVEFKLSVAEASSGSRTVLVRPHVASEGVSELAGNGEKEFHIVVNNVNAGESFAVAHVDEGLAFIQVYVILGQARYILVCEALQGIKQELIRARVRIPPPIQQALRSTTSVAAASPPVSAPAPAAPPQCPVIPLPILSPEALRHPLIENGTIGKLHALVGVDNWRTDNCVRIGQYEGFFGRPQGAKAYYRSELTGRRSEIKMYDGGLGDDREIVWDWFWKNFTSDEGIMGFVPRYVTNHLPLGLCTREGGRMAWNLSDRLGLPLVKVVVNFFRLTMNRDDEIRALSLPLAAGGIDKPIPIAVLSIGPNGWQREYDYSPNAGLAVRSLPNISGIGSPLLREVLPARAMVNPQAMKNACEWYALPDLLARLWVGSLQAVCFFVVHSQGIEIHITLLRKKMEYNWRRPAGHWR
jgi:hypothetical protein